MPTKKLFSIEALLSIFVVTLLVATIVSPRGQQADVCARYKDTIATLRSKIDSLTPSPWGNYNYGYSDSQRVFVVDLGDSISITWCCDSLKFFHDTDTTIYEYMNVTPPNQRLNKQIQNAKDNRN